MLIQLLQMVITKPGLNKQPAHSSLSVLHIDPGLMMFRFMLWLQRVKFLNRKVRG
jgi:hypothetical protein